MKQVTLTSPSKVNLFLEVLGRRDDGYHEICSIVVLTELCDTIILERRTSGITIRTRDPKVPSGPDNLCHRAADLLLRHSGVHGGLGSAFERSRQIDKAETIFRKLLVVDPTNADAYNYLGYMFADEGIRLDESVALVKKALELQPDNGAFVDSLGWAYYKKGMVDEALAELKRAAELSKKEDPTIFEHLGDVYFRKQMVPEAIKEWERSLAIDSANEAVQNKLRKARDVLSREGG